MDEKEHLRQRLLEADHSITNPGIVQVMEQELETWVRMYESGDHSYYDILGTTPIPDTIMFNSQTYTPRQVLAHIQARDDIGMALLKQIEQNRTDEDWLALRSNMAHALSGRDDLDAMPSHPLEKQVPLRQFYEEVIAGDPASDCLRIGLPHAIMRLYCEPPDLPWD